MNKEFIEKIYDTLYTKHIMQIATDGTYKKSTFELRKTILWGIFTTKLNSLVEYIANEYDTNKDKMPEEELLLNMVSNITDFHLFIISRIQKDLLIYSLMKRFNHG